MVLAPLEGDEVVEGKRLLDLLGPQDFVEELAVATQSERMAGDGLGRGVMLAGDLPEGGALDQVVEDELQKLGALEPVGQTEGLFGEVAPTVATPETLDAVG